jgi:hypothetical protein
VATRDLSQRWAGRCITKDEESCICFGISVCTATQALQALTPNLICMGSCPRQECWVPSCNPHTFGTKKPPTSMSLCASLQGWTIVKPGQTFLVEECTCIALSRPVGRNPAIVYPGLQRMLAVFAGKPRGCREIKQSRRCSGTPESAGACHHIQPHRLLKHCIQERCPAHIPPLQLATWTAGGVKQP